MKNSRLYYLSFLSLFLMGCAGKNQHESYTVGEPLTAEEEREEEMGKLFGDDSPFDFSNKKTLFADSGTIQINKYLWFATLEALKDIPLKHIDARGGFIETEPFRSEKGEVKSLRVVFVKPTLQLSSFKITEIPYSTAQNHKSNPQKSSLNSAQELKKIIFEKAKTQKFSS